MIAASVKAIVIAVTLLLGQSNGFCQQAPPNQTAPQALNNSDILKMSEVKLADAIIISKIHASACNFDTSTDALLKLKAAGISDSVLQAIVEAGTNNSPAAGSKQPAADPNNPRSPHDGGIYWLQKEKRDNQMVGLEPSVYSAGKSGGFFSSAMTYGIAKIHTNAVVRGDRATLRISEASPEFWFYFEEKSAGLSQSGGFSTGASSPNEFILAKMQKKSKDRELTVEEMNAFGASSGTRDKDVVDFDFVKVAPGIYKVTPKSPLPPGEYCFFYAGENMSRGMAGGKLFDFGIDSAQ
jgi:hypothetical protein